MEPVNKNVVEARESRWVIKSTGGKGEGQEGVVQWETVRRKKISDSKG